MKSFLSLCLAIAVCILVTTGCKNTNKEQPGTSTQATQNAKSSRHMFGKVSNDGKTFVNGGDSQKYNVNNPDAVANYEGQDAAMLVQVDPETNTIHVVQIEPMQTMSGKVSQDGKTFTSDSGSKNYTVSNPDALKGHEGQHVALIVHVDPQDGVLHIAQVEMPGKP
jgi:biopolymer transport protein ExbD